MRATKSSVNTSKSVNAALTNESRVQNMTAPLSFDCSPTGYNDNQTLSTPTGGGVGPHPA